MTDKTEIDTGGPVYPYTQNELIRGNAKGRAEYRDVTYPGITRRDQCADRIAAGIACGCYMALSKSISDGLIAGLTPEKSLEYAQKTREIVLEEIAKDSYAITDAMIAEGRKGE